MGESEQTNSSQLEILKSVLVSAYEKLICKWNYIGHSSEIMAKKYEALEENLQLFFSEILTEEEEWGNAKEREIEGMRENAKKLIVLLKKNEPEILSKIGPDMAPLLQFEKQMSAIYGNLLAEKEEIFNTYRKLNEEAKKIGAEVAETPPSFPCADQLEFHSSEELISTLNQFIEMMKREKKIREKNVKQLRKSAQESLWLLGAAPVNNHERNALQVESVLSKQLIADLTAINSELEEKVSAAKAEREVLCAKIQTLSVTAGKPAEILPSGILPDSLNRLKAKVAQLEECLKQKNAPEPQVAESARTNVQNRPKRRLREKSPECVIVEGPSENSETGQSETSEERRQIKRNNSTNIKSEPEGYEDEDFEVLYLSKVKTEFEIRTFDISSDESENEISAETLNEQSLDSNSDLWTSARSKLFTQTSTESLNSGWKQNIEWQNESDTRREAEKNDDLKMLKIIGASKWHAYVTGNAIWQKMTQRPEGFPDRGFPLLKSRFLETVLRKLSSYGLSEAEMELYKGVEEKETEFNVPATPFNPNFINYKL